jgi:hypothetical protein
LIIGNINFISVKWIAVKYQEPLRNEFNIWALIIITSIHKTSRMTFYFKPFMVLSAILLLASSTTIAQKRKVPKKQAKTATSNELIKNGIILQSRGFKVAEAYLVFDDENLVPEGNKVALNQNVNMLLIIDSGWTENNGRVYPGSKQVLKLNTGAEILTQEELFAAFDETGVSAEDARYIKSRE